MRHTHGRVVHVESLADFDRRLAEGAASLSGWRVRGLNLAERGVVLRQVAVAGATFLGCRFAPGDEDAVESRGALVLPVLPQSPVDPYRATLYTPEELYDAQPYSHSYDAVAYAWSQGPATSAASLAQAMHDHAIDEALTEWIADRRLVGVMGGHAAERGGSTYVEAAHLGRTLGGTHVITTGGGPGAMEAAHLGSRLAGHPAEALDDALDRLRSVPSYHPSVDAWLAPARDVCQDLAPSEDSLAIPTWHYGHEPTNVFATAIAKYFRNATREAVLLEVCSAGIVFLPGAGGTIQEIFQDACENYYADASSVAPMVLVGGTYWTNTLPAWPLLRRLAAGRVMEPHVHLVDTVAEAAEVITGV